MLYSRSLLSICFMYSGVHTSQMALMVKNFPANAGDIGDRSPAGYSSEGCKETQLKQLSVHAARVNTKFLIYPYCPNLEQPKMFYNKFGKGYSYF